MSVTIARRIVARLRELGVTVHESDGCFNRGNGLTSDYLGLSIHHTASDYGKDYRTLYEGRSDLAGPLCNTSGNDDGSITLIAAHPANHAGASGGWDTAPLPVTSLFNKHMWGHEIVYPGSKPMRDAQYRSALVLARVVCEVLDVPVSHVKTHNGTSVTGKWDPGFAPNKTIDIAAFRRECLSASGDDVSAQEVWDHPVIVADGTPDGAVVRAVDVLTRLTQLDQDLRGDLSLKAKQIADQARQITTLSGTVAGLTKALASASTLTAEQITAAVAAGLQDAAGPIQPAAENPAPPQNVPAAPQNDMVVPGQG